LTKEKESIDIIKEDDGHDESADSSDEEFCTDLIDIYHLQINFPSGL